MKQKSPPAAYVVRLVPYMINRSHTPDSPCGVNSTLLDAGVKVISHIIQTMGVKYGWKMILGLNLVTAILSATELYSKFTRPVKEPVSESSDDGD
ncbi:hypothetical protein SeMB42_g03139 [Synchytrium endobioticum]|uniref:Uncharacterized protein n=1 Tax=Synchytrium endobioticum TaxID=286115 RepID=A0A507D8S3_9FUNG|nr:hypothetical protein SeMB42_g03139 [Synchytrium endobioticum]